MTNILGSSSFPYLLIQYLIPDYLGYEYKSLTYLKHISLIPIRFSLFLSLSFLIYYLASAWHPFNLSSIFYEDDLYIIKLDQVALLLGAF